jgi:hypothetical protein
VCKEAPDCCLSFYKILLERARPSGPSFFALVGSVLFDRACVFSCASYYYLLLGVLGRRQRGDGKLVRDAVIAYRPDDKVGTTPRSFRARGIALTDPDTVGVGTVLLVLAATTFTLEGGVRDRSRRSQEFDKLHCVDVCLFVVS